MNKFPWTKLVVLLFIIVIGTIVDNTITPRITTVFSIQAQLDDSNVTRASYDAYTMIREYFFVVYIVIGLLMFRKEIKKLIGGMKK